MSELASFGTAAWTAAMLPNRYVLAFQVGRLSNCLHWATSRAALWPKAETLGAVAGIFDRLLELAYKLDAPNGVAAPSVAALTAEVARIRDGFAAAIDGEGYEVWAEQIADEPDAWWPETWDWSPAVRDAFASCFDLVGVAAMRAGWHVDRGLRPLPGEGVVLSIDERRRLRRLIIASQASAVSLTGGPLWLGEAKGLCHRLGVEPEFAAADNPVACVEAVDAHLRAALTHLWETATITPAPKSTAPTIMVPASAEETVSATDVCTHTEDFTSIRWYGVPYTFTKGQQAVCVAALWKTWEDGLTCLAQETIGERVGSSNENFELSKVFRSPRPGGGYEPHPAWKTMIRPIGKGSYGLHPSKK